MITALFMGWTAPVTKQWFPIKKMTWQDDKYYVVYLQGMLSVMEVSESHRTLVKAGLVKLDRLEVSRDINISFKPRMPVNRSFSDIEQLDRLGLSTDLSKFDPFEYVARIGGRTVGDTYDLFPEVQLDCHDKYHFYFGIDDIEGLDITPYLLESCASSDNNRLQIGERLSLGFFA
jgi:hypothetical protein